MKHYGSAVCDEGDQSHAVVQPTLLNKAHRAIHPTENDENSPQYLQHNGITEGCDTLNQRCDKVDDKETLCVSITFLSTTLSQAYKKHTTVSSYRTKDALYIRHRINLRCSTSGVLKHRYLSDCCTFQQKRAGLLAPPAFTTASTHF